MKYRVADLIADGLVAHGVSRVFSVPGESFLPLLDALYERPEIDLVTSRHEGSAALCAIADAKLTGRVGVAMVSRGPGAFNAALGLHVAHQEAIPLLLLVGQVETWNVGRGAVQEVDTGTTFAPVIKWSTRIEDPKFASEQLARAFATSMSGTPGPVVIEMPEDGLERPASRHSERVHGTAYPRASEADLSAAAELLSVAQRPLMIVGGECRTATFRESVVKLSEHLGIPVVVTNKNQDQFPNTHALFAGQIGFFASPALVELFDQADLIFAIGTRLGELSSMGFSFPRQLPEPQILIHVYPDAAAIGRHFTTAAPIVASAGAFVSAALALLPPRQAGAEWIKQVAETRRKLHGWAGDAVPEADVFARTVGLIAGRSSPDCIVTTDSGNFAAWVHRIFQFQPSNRLLGSACGAMGTGVPSGLAAALRYPDRQVIAFCGDGGFLMTGNELAVAAARRADLKIVVANNGSYGTIRAFQEKAYPGRGYGTDLVNPDFAAIARAFGARGYSVRSNDEASKAVDAAFSERGPALIAVNFDRAIR